jgi:hypothetical protein
MKMRSLKHKKGKTNEIAGLKAASMPNETYPYGTRMHLDHDTLEKLGVSKLPAVGKKMRMQARARVVSASENSSTNESGKPMKRRSLELQLEHMGLEHDAPQSAEEAVDSGIDDADADGE